MTPGLVSALGWPILAFGVATLSVRAMISYARRHDMLDQPGRRRSHTVATPRGGGAGIVAGSLVTVPWLLARDAPALCAAVFVGTLLVALVGWIDDRRSLPALPRLVVQLLATTVLALALLADGLAIWWLPLLVLAGTWSINLHNFMDGIDGLLALQAMFVAGGLSVLAWASGQTWLAVAASCLVAACFAFWRFNRTPARIFMGDAGSGSVGLLLFALSAACAVAAPRTLAPVLVLSATFVVDATLTLASRVCRGRRWYTPHREHLYQWLARRWHSHPRVCALFLVWNLLVLAPLAWLARGSSALAYGAVASAYGLTAAGWWVLKRRCLRRKTSGTGDVVA